MTITISSYSLSTNYQPVSLVVTGGFDFDRVFVNDDTTKDYEDKPKKMVDWGGIMIVVFLIILCVFAVVIVMYLQLLS